MPAGLRREVSSCTRCILSPSPELFLAQGHITKAFDGTATLAIRFSNFAQILVDKGELRLAQDSRHEQNSETAIDSDGVLRFSGFTHNFNVGASVVGFGQMIVERPLFPLPTTLDFAQNTRVAVSSFLMTGDSSSLTGSPEIDCGTFDWRAGTIEGSSRVIVRLGNTMTISGGPILALNASITNYGTVDWVGDADFTMSGNAAVSNNGSNEQGIFNIKCGFDILDGAAAGTSPNARLEAIQGAIIRVENGGGNNIIQVPLIINQGELSLNGHSLRLETRDPNVVQDYEPINGITDLDGGQLVVTGSFVQTGGITTLGNGAGEISASFLSVTAGTFDMGGGTIDLTIFGDLVLFDGAILRGGGTINGNVMNWGTISISDGTMIPNHVLTLWGSYTQMATGVLKVTMGGANNYDQMNVFGDVTLSGFLDVMLDNYNPGNALSFEVLTFTGQRFGMFTQVRAVGNNISWTADYNTADRVNIQS